MSSTVPTVVLGFLWDTGFGQHLQLSLVCVWDIGFVQHRTYSRPGFPVGQWVWPTPAVVLGLCVGHRVCPAPYLQSSWVSCGTVGLANTCSRPGFPVGQWVWPTPAVILGFLWDSGFGQHMQSSWVSCGTVGLANTCSHPGFDPLRKIVTDGCPAVE